MRFVFIAFLLLPLACKKDKSCNTLPVDATIVWSGPVAADGCDWLVKTDSVTFYHPDVLDTDFQHDGLNVKIKFTQTNQRFACGFSNMGPYVIHVISIRK